MVPILFGVLISYAVSNANSMSIFDVILEIKNLPFLPTLSNVSTYNVTAKDLMNSNFFYLTAEAKLADITVIINKVGYYPVTIPVV
jgi:hypothetical protein